MIDILQIKAARVLLEWTQKQLAQASDVSAASIAKLEQGKGKRDGKVMAAIQQALEKAGIEFTPEPGVRLVREKFQFRVFEGREAIFELWDDIIAALGTTGGEVLISGISDRYWIENYKNEFAAALKRQRDHKIFSRILIEEGDNVIVIGPKVYRSIPSYLFQQMPVYIYADRVAIINWGPPQRVLLIQNPLINDGFRRQFEFNYEIGKPLNKKNLVVVKLEGLPYLP
ncbi:MAG: multiprotein-bridging factor 1 family protein [Bdellovibrionales bacterium]